MQHTHESAMEKKFRTREMDVLLEGLEIYKNSPGVMQLQMNLRKWMTTHVKVLTLGDFCHFAEEASSTQVANLDELEKLMVRCNNIAAPKDDPKFQEQVLIVTQASLLAVLALVACQ